MVLWGNATMGMSLDADMVGVDAASAACPEPISFSSSRSGPVLLVWGNFVPINTLSAQFKAGYLQAQVGRTADGVVPGEVGGRGSIAECLFTQCQVCNVRL